MMDALPRSARRVQEALEAAGLALRVVELPDSTRTAREAAEAIGCRIAEIAKTVVFRGVHDDLPRLVVASGTNHVDPDQLRSWAGGAVALADPTFVRAATGYAIGGVPPIGHPTAIPTWVDEDLLGFEEVWAAAGTPRTVFALQPAQLVAVTAAQVGPVKAP